MTKNETIRAFKALGKNMARFKELEKLIAKLEREREKVALNIRVGEHISFIYKGAPIGETGDGFEALDTDRRTHFYKNAHNGKTWGIRVVKGFGCDGTREETWLGAGYKTFREVKAIALEFCATGAVPAPKDRRY